MASLEQQFTGLTPEQRRLVELWFQQQDEPPVWAPVPERIPRRASSGASPLSFMQQQLWLVYQLEPESSAYNFPISIRLAGRLDPATLERSLNAVVQRHEVLRTTFHVENGQPCQIIAPTQHIPLPLVELAHAPLDERETRMQLQISQTVEQPLDLEHGPLLRARLLRLAADEHVLVLALHHSVFDGWSQGILLRELTTLYAASQAGKPSPLPDLPIQYADYALWQREYVQSQALKEQWDYWKRQLAGMPGALDLPTDRPRPPIATHHGAVHHFSLAAPLVEQLKDLSWREGATLFMTLLAAFDVLLYRYTGQTDLVVGSPIAGRNRSELEDLIGCFMNMLALRADLSGDPPFSELLGRVRKAALGGYAHQELPFEKLVEALQPARDLSRSPLFQVLFALQNVPLPPLRYPGLTITPVDMIYTTSMFDLSLFLRETEQAISGRLEYNTDLFEPETMARLVGHYQMLLTDIVSNPQKRISALRLMPKEEMRRLLVEWNTTRRDYPRERCMHELFEAQVARTPEAMAVMFEDGHLSYAELNRRANQLAHHLHDLGVGPEVLVGLCMERSLKMVIGLLGILKAGGAYVPLDPAYPPERLAFMLADSGTPVLLTSHTLNTSPDTPSVKRVYLDADWRSLAHLPTTPPPCAAQPDSPAYVIYTSGSTGAPKGVVISHAHIVRLLAATQPWFHFDAHDVWSLFHSFAFDFSVWEMWGALAYGGRLVLVSYPVSRSPEAFYHLLLTQHVTVLNQIPSAFRQLIRAEAARPLQDTRLALRFVIFGGEALDLPALRPWFERHGDQTPQLVNMYGITETTVHVTYRPITWPDVAAAVGSLIGCAIPDLALYVLDPLSLQPVPIGIPGELYVGGAGLARGYLNRPDLTAERFMPNPFASHRPGERLYKTGDQARYLPTGDLEYLGRLDAQVKLRGFRIELGEIEAALLQHPALHEALVVLREDSPGNPRLVAYLVPAQQLAPSVNDLRSFLKARLPDYMLPAAFVTLSALPLAPSGKINRRALPAPDTARPDLDEVFVAPRTPEEQALADIWANALGLERVGVQDNFFTLGGDSILSIRVIAQAHERGLNLSLPQLFQHPTIQDLALELEPAGPEKLSLKSIPLLSLISEEDRQNLPDDVEDAYPLSRLQAGMIFHSAYRPDTAVYHNVSSYHLRAPFDERKLRAAIQQLASRHAVLRTSFDLNSYSQPLQLVHRTVDVPFYIDDLRHLAPSEQEALLAQWFEREKNNPFDWTQPPLLRFHVHRRSEETFQFSLVEHHAILDGWSMASMLTELFQIYLGLLGKDVPPLRPALNLTFRDFVALERSALESQAAQEYWADKLEGSSFVRLPRWPDIRREAQVHMLPIPLSNELSDGLRRVARSAGVPLKSVLLAAHIRVMSLLNGQPDVVTGLVSNSRTEGGDGEQVLGLFLNTVPFRLELSNGTWLDLVRKTFMAERELLPFRVYPLADLQKIHGGQPLFETAFNFIHFHVYQGVLKFQDIQVLEGDGFQATNFTLVTNFSVSPASSEIQLALQYNAEELGEEQIKAMGEYYLRALSAMADAPLERCLDRSLLSEMEQRQLLVEWNGIRSEQRVERCIHTWFEEQAQRTPDAIALVLPGDESAAETDAALSYRTLDQRTNQLAHHLQSLGVGPEALVGLCLERSLEMVVGLLAILKAGGAYVPLDPSYPPERIAFMLTDSRAPVLLTSQRLSMFQGLTGLTRVYLDTDWPVIAQSPTANPQSPVSPEHLAYVIYTSGSTGQPKGVLIPHEALAAHCHNIWQVYALSADDRVLQFATFSFDTSLEQILPTLTVGATLVLRGETLRPPEGFCELVEELAVTRANLPVVYWQQVSQAGVGRTDTPRALRLMIVGGEAMPAESVRVWRETPLRGVRLLNAYGPTETTVTATVFEVNDWAASHGARVPIGRAMAHRVAYVVDAHGQLAPVGVPGELWLGGLGLGRGYLNRPDLTAERFVPNPFVKDDHSPRSEAEWEGGRMKDEANDLAPAFILHPSFLRLYRTGDRVRWRADGQLEFLGRLDHQVKVRGYRIELGEIEATLAEHPSVREDVVVVREDRPGEKTLVAYVVAQEGETFAANEAREFLRRCLPEYMLPSTFVFLESLPLTPNGKIDRRALPAPQAARLEADAAFVAPRDAVELRLVRLWEDILGVQPISVRQSFFELGGHSLLAVRLVARIEQAFGSRLPVATLFQRSTIEQLAALLREGEQATLWSSLVPMQIGEAKRRALFFVHPGSGNVLGYLDLLRHLEPEQPVYGLQSRGMDGREPPFASVEDMARHYIELVRGVQADGPYCLGGWSMGGVVAFEMAGQLQAAGQTVELLALIDTYAPSADADAEPDEVGLLRSFALDISVTGRGFSFEAECLSREGLENQLGCLLEQAKQAGVVPLDLELAQVHRLFSVFKSNVLAMQRYQPRDYSGRVTLFKAAQVMGEQTLPEDMGWSARVHGGLSVEVIPGTHYTLVREPNVETLADKLKLYLSG